VLPVVDEPHEDPTTADERREPTGTEANPEMDSQREGTGNERVTDES